MIEDIMSSVKCCGVSNVVAWFKIGKLFLICKAENSDE